MVYTLINEIVEDIPPPLLEALFQKIIEVPESQYSEMYLLFLKDFTQRAFEVAERERQQAAAQEESVPGSNS